MRRRRLVPALDFWADERVSRQREWCWAINGVDVFQLSRWAQAPAAPGSVSLTRHDTPPIATPSPFLNPASRRVVVGDRVKFVADSHAS